MDVKTAFLNGELEEEIYMTQLLDLEGKSRRDWEKSIEKERVYSCKWGGGNSVSDPQRAMRPTLSYTCLPIILSLQITFQQQNHFLTTMATTQAVKEGIWLRNLLKSLGFMQNKATMVNCDN